MTQAKFDIEAKAKGIASRLMISGEKVTGEQLAREFGLAGDEQVRDVIHWARTQGDPAISRIAAGRSGYFWAPTKEVGLPTIKGLRGRGLSMFDAAKGMAAAYGINNIEQEALPL